MIPHGPVEPGAVGKDAAVFEPHRKRRLPTRQVLPVVGVSVRPVDLGHLGEQEIVARFHERSPSPFSFLDEILDHVLVLHRC